MKNFKYKSVKNVISRFLWKIEKAVLYTHLRFDDFQYLSKRRIYKILSMIFMNDGIQFNKKELKEFSKKLKKVDLNNMNRKDIEDMFKLVWTHDFYNFINLDEIISKFFDILFSIFPEKDIKNPFMEKAYLTIGSLRI